VLLDDLPLGDLSPERVELLSLEGRNATPAWYARLARQYGHSVPPVKMNLLRKDLYCRNFSPSSFGLLVSSRQYHISSTPEISEISRRACAFGGCRCLFPTLFT